LLAARDAASAAIAAHGVVIMAPTGAIKANPAVGALLKLERRVADLLNDFENVVVQHGNKRISAF
jgi:hypothetical protein